MWLITLTGPLMVSPSPPPLYNSNPKPYFPLALCTINLMLRFSFLTPFSSLPSVVPLFLIPILFLWFPAPSAESSISAPSLSYASEPTVTPACSHHDLGHSHSAHNNGGVGVKEHSVIDMITASAPDTIVISKGTESSAFHTNDSKTGDWTFHLLLMDRKQSESWFYCVLQMNQSLIWVIRVIYSYTELCEVWGTLYYSTHCMISVL